MATYKVIQDIEAEDKLVGPFTLRQFIYAGIVMVSGFFIFQMILVNPFLAIPLLPHTIFFIVLAAPFGHDQSSEVWLLAKVRYFLKPRKRIWNQSGASELVTITAPPKIQHSLTNGLNQTEVKSRLQALANTIDSRGWAVKNVNVNLFNQPVYAVESSDRLVGPSSLPQDVGISDVTPMDDMMDAQNNPTAQQLDQMMAASAQNHRQQVVSQMSQTSPQGPGGSTGTTQAPPDYWFLSQNQKNTPAPGFATVDARVVAPGQTSSSSRTKDNSGAEEAILQQLHKNQEKPNPTYGHMRTLQPLGKAESPESGVQSSQSKSPISSGPAAQSSQPPTVATAKPNPAIIGLANNDDLNVATIARVADKEQKRQPPDEVVISLH